MLICKNVRAMDRVVTVRLLTDETQVRIQATLCGICGGKSNVKTGISKITSIFLSLFQQCAILIFIYMLLSVEQILRTLQKVTLFRKSGNNVQESTFTWSFKATGFENTFTKIETIERTLL
jgi:hypothetical protein